MMAPHGNWHEQSKLSVVLFSGGRGSQVLSRQLINHPQVSLTLAINGYDDGASTGEVRRLLGDSLGPSDFRKNASRLARELHCCSPQLIECLDLRFPVGYSLDEARAVFALVNGSATTKPTEFQAKLLALLVNFDDAARLTVARRLKAFEHELRDKQTAFSFSDCSLGNLVFAGGFVERGRDFNRAIADYCALLNLPEGLIENVTDGANAYLIAVDRDQRWLGSEADIVNAERRNHIKDLYLIDRLLTSEEEVWLGSADDDAVAHFLSERSRPPSLNPRLLERIKNADLIIYSPGTQHSSLFPSYLTPGLGAAIAQNLTAIKLLITNLQEDAEIPDSSAVDIIEKATYYLKERATLTIPTPCLITHYLINDHQREQQTAPYVPLGRLESLEDPRLVRIGNYEEGITGHHDAAKLLTPFIETLLQRGARQRIAVWLLDASSLNKVSQTILEMLRGGVNDLPVSVSVFYQSSESFAKAFTRSLPFTVENTVGMNEDGGASGFLRTLTGGRFDYVILFESSGMYLGEDIVNLAALLTNQRLDAVWGSRRLSVRDIRESYRLRYHHNPVLGAISYVGSHLLSLCYLLLYGRYISDTLSGARAIRATYLSDTPWDLNHPCFNQQLLSRLLLDRADVFETPVQFFSLSPDRVRRTTSLDGLRSLFTILWQRFKPRKTADAVTRSKVTSFPDTLPHEAEEHSVSEKTVPVTSAIKRP